MEKNVGGYDRLGRLVFGPVLILLGIAGLSGLLTLAAGTTGFALAAVAVIVGAVFVVTATVQKCPLNSVLGFDTYRPTRDSNSTADESDPSPR